MSYSEYSVAFFSSVIAALPVLLSLWPLLIAKGADRAPLLPGTLAREGEVGVLGQDKNARPGGFRCAESTREQEPTSWARSASRLQVCGALSASPLLISRSQVPLPCSQHEATSSFSPTSPLGPGVLLSAPLAVGTVHSLPQVCAWGSICPHPAWLRARSHNRESI